MACRNISGTALAAASHCLSVVQDEKKSTGSFAATSVVVDLRNSTKNVRVLLVRTHRKQKKRGQVRNDTHVRGTSPPFSGNQDRRISYVLRSRACQYAVTYIVSSRYDDSLTRHTRYINTSAIVSSLGQYY